MFVVGVRGGGGGSEERERAYATELPLNGRISLDYVEIERDI